MAFLDITNLSLIRPSTPHHTKLKVHFRKGITTDDGRRHPNRCGGCVGRVSGCLLKVLDLDVALVALLGLVRGPEGEVVTKELHNEGGVLVRFF